MGICLHRAKVARLTCGAATPRAAVAHPTALPRPPCRCPLPLRGLPQGSIHGHLWCSSAFVWLMCSLWLFGSVHTALPGHPVHVFDMKILPLSVAFSAGVFYNLLLMLI